MSTIAPVDRAGGVIPVMRRDRAHYPAAGDDPDRRDRPAGRDPRDAKRDPPPETEGPAVPPHSTFGRIVNTFAIAH